MEDETVPEAFLNFAKSYCEAANILFEARSTKDHNHLLEEPIYLLYFHATELTLKAYLRHKGYKTKELKSRDLGHKLEVLYSRCIAAGFTVSSDFALDLRNITELLDSGNDNSAFRYWNPKSLTTASIDWIKKVINKLIQEMENLIPISLEPGPAVKGTLIVGEPQSIE